LDPESRKRAFDRATASVEVVIAMLTAWVAGDRDVAYQLLDEALERPTSTRDLFGSLLDMGNALVSLRAQLLGVSPEDAIKLLALDMQRDFERTRQEEFGERGDPDDELDQGDEPG
jgi:hypothetical protein